MTILFSLCALGFTIYSFYWMNWRPGKLGVTPSKTFAAACENGRVIIRLPLVFQNSGARPIIVQNLQLTILNSHLAPLYFNAIIKKLDAEDDGDYATQVALNANSTLELICEFKTNDTDFHFNEGKPSLRLKAQIDDNKWEEIKTFQIYIGGNASLALASGSVVVVKSDF